MRSLRLCAVALLLILLAARGVPAEESSADSPPDYGEADAGADAPSAAPDPGEYEQSLVPYGRWTDGGSYGRVWSPAVSYGWQPYVDGYWAWSPYGWTWISDEPWSWTFHYGRWALLPVGWVWVPGTVWGPAWVDWYWGDGLVGWAPLSPFASHVTAINSFVFVSDGDFCSHRIRHLVRDWRRVPDGVVHHWDRRDFGPPPEDRIQRIAREPVQHFDGRPPGTIGPPVLDDRGPRFVRRDERPVGEPGFRRRDGMGFQRGGPDDRPPRDDPGRGDEGSTTFAPPARGGQRPGRPRPVPDAPVGRIPETPPFRGPAEGGARSFRVPGGVTRGPGVAAERPTMNVAPPLVPPRGGFMHGGGRAESGHEHPGAGGGGGSGPHAPGQGGMLVR